MWPPSGGTLLEGRPVVSSSAARMRRVSCCVTLCTHADTGAVLEFDVALSARNSTSAEEGTLGSSFSLR